MMKSADNTLFQTKTTTKHKRKSMDKNTHVLRLCFAAQEGIPARRFSIIYRKARELKYDHE